MSANIPITFPCSGAFWSVSDRLQIALFIISMFNFLILVSCLIEVSIYFEWLSLSLHKLNSGDRWDLFAHSQHVIIEIPFIDWPIYIYGLVLPLKLENLRLSLINWRHLLAYQSRRSVADSNRIEIFRVDHIVASIQALFYVVKRLLELFRV